MHRILKTEMCISISFICYEVFIEHREKRRKIALIFIEPIAPALVSHNNITIVSEVYDGWMNRFNRVNCLNIRSSDSWLQGRGGYSAADIRVLKVDNLNWSQVSARLSPHEGNNTCMVEVSEIQFCRKMEKCHHI